VALRAHVVLSIKRIFRQTAIVNVPNVRISKKKMNRIINKMSLEYGTGGNYRKRRGSVRIWLPLVDEKSTRNSRPFALRDRAWTGLVKNGGEFTKNARRRLSRVHDIEPL